MKKFSSLLIVLLLMLTSFKAGAEDIRGDVNRDGTVDITDVTWLINYLLHGTWYDDPVDNHEWVDLGLPSGTLWATCNVGASSPEGYGGYFAWGETAPKDYYDYTYKWYKEGYYDANNSWHNGGLTKYCTYAYDGYDGFTDGKTELDPSDDAATANWGSGARMPSLEQIKELRDNCSWQWTQRNGVYGRQGIGPNGNTIFLPAAGYRWRGSLNDAGSDGLYWSRTLHPDNSYDAYILNFYSGGVNWDDSRRFYGHPVRAVRVSQN